MDKSKQYDSYLLGYRAALLNPVSALNVSFSELGFEERLAFLRGYTDGVVKRPFTSFSDLQEEIKKALDGLRVSTQDTSTQTPVFFLDSSDFKSPAIEREPFEETPILVDSEEDAEIKSKLSRQPKPHTPK